MIVGIERAKETFPQNYTTRRSLDASHVARRLSGDAKIDQLNLSQSSFQH